METLARKEIVDELKIQWRNLWRERIDDKVKAEGIANNDYAKLFVEKGTVIFATRNFKILNFRDILELNGIVDVDKLIPPNPHVGGWGKFIRTVVATQKPHRRNRRVLQYIDFKKEQQQLKKGGRGWLHY
ncbi:hypothetical protein HXY33_07230 [Candidatus Bathyarchaeota archaeon]|nr:hypothetical protein [Candidatus Bathyarchaeota archaeon]